MKAKNLFSPILLCAAIALFSTSCKEKKGAADVKGNGLPVAGKGAPSNIAYVEIDTLQSQYQFCKDNQGIFTRKSEAYKTQLNAKSQALQQAAAEFQQKMQANAYTQDQARSQQARLQQMQAELQQMQENLESKFSKEQQAYNKQLRDSVQNFLKEYNATHHYSLILSKAGDNILYAEPGLDITQDVVNGLNKRYKKK